MCSGDEIGSAGKLPHSFHLQLNSKLSTAFQRVRELNSSHIPANSLAHYTAKFKVIEHIFYTFFLLHRTTIQSEEAYESVSVTCCYLARQLFATTNRLVPPQKCYYRTDSAQKRQQRVPIHRKTVN